MKITVTVELDEGVKASSTFDVPSMVHTERIDGKVESITMEAVLIGNTGRHTENIKEILGVEPKLIDLTTTHAGLAIGKILGFFKKHKAMLIQRNKNGLRTVLAVTDVDEAEKWLADADL